ncbi:MAG: enoyl-CoA hydratase/isomerase family protein [Proteobacteria bacterium]|nr:enoyl-CoA hydratase/isomerase family protein [Pseudomonadota bacterium]
MSKGITLSPGDIGLDRTDPAIAMITINRPARRNAMTLAMWRELARLFDENGRDAAIRAIILTGAGGTFCAGADISEFPAVRSTPADGAVYEAAADACLTAIQTSPKATIAAISGACYGGGMGLALSCDFRVADASAYFAIPAARLSNVYGIIETRALYDAVGLAVAKEVLFSGRRYSYEEALASGMATHASKNGALEAAKDVAKSLAASAPLTIKGAKAVLAALASGDVDRRHSEIQAIMDAALASADYKEGVAAFSEKREPRFRGV